MESINSLHGMFIYLVINNVKVAISYFKIFQKWRFKVLLASISYQPWTKAEYYQQSLNYQQQNFAQYYPFEKIFESSSQHSLGRKLAKLQHYKYIPHMLCTTELCTLCTTELYASHTTPIKHHKALHAMHHQVLQKDITKWTHWECVRVQK
jgi:hypothetical protein